MKREDLYHLRDVIKEIKQLDNLIASHESLGADASSLMIEQYKARKNQLLTYFINEVNASAENRTNSLFVIKRVMERFYPESKSDKKSKIKLDKNYVTLVNALD